MRTIAKTNVRTRDVKLARQGGDPTCAACETQEFIQVLLAFSFGARYNADMIKRK